MEKKGFSAVLVRETPSKALMDAVASNLNSWFRYQRCDFHTNKRNYLWFGLVISPQWEHVSRQSVDTWNPWRCRAPVWIDRSSPRQQDSGNCWLPNHFILKDRGKKMSIIEINEKNFFSGLLLLHSQVLKKKQGASKNSDVKKWRFQDH